MFYHVTDGGTGGFRQMKCDVLRFNYTRCCCEYQADPPQTTSKGFYLNSNEYNLNAIILGIIVKGRVSYL